MGNFKTRCGRAQKGAFYMGFYPEGTPIKCYECGRELYRTTRGLWEGDAISASCFDPIGDMPPLLDNTSSPACIHCGCRDWFEHWICPWRYGEWEGVDT